MKRENSQSCAQLFPSGITDFWHQALFWGAQISLTGWTASSWLIKLPPSMIFEESLCEGWQSCVHCQRRFNRRHEGLIGDIKTIMMMDIDDNEDSAYTLTHTSEIYQALRHLKHRNSFLTWEILRNSHLANHETWLIHFFFAVLETQKKKQTQQVVQKVKKPSWS